MTSTRRLFRGTTIAATVALLAAAFAAASAEQGTEDPGLINSGESFGNLKLKIKAGKSAKSGKRGSILITAHSHTDSSEVDALKIVPVVK